MTLDQTKDTTLEQTISEEEQQELQKLQRSAVVASSQLDRRSEVNTSQWVHTPSEEDQIRRSKQLAEQLAEEAEEAEQAEEQARREAEEQRRLKEYKLAQQREAENIAKREVEAAEQAKRRAAEDKAWKEAEEKRRLKESVDRAQREKEAAQEAKRRAAEDKAWREAEEKRRVKEAAEQAKRNRVERAKKAAEDQARNIANTPIPMTFSGRFKGRPSKRFILVTVVEARMAVNDVAVSSNANMRRQLRIKVASKSKYSSVDEPLPCADGRHISWPWVTRNFRLAVPHNVNYARFELMGPSTASSLCCKMPLSTLIPGVELEQWFDMKTKRGNKSAKGQIGGVALEAEDQQAMQLHLKLQLVKERQIRVVGGGGAGGSGAGRRGSFLIARGAHAGKSTSSLDEETKRAIESFTPGRVYHKSVQLQNEELGQVLVAPRTNSQGVPLHLRHMPHAHLESFMMHQYAADLISHRQSTALIDELSGSVRESQKSLTKRSDEDIDVELGVLLLAGDGRLRRSPEMSNLHSELLSFLDLEELDEDSKFLPEGNTGVEANTQREAQGWDTAKQEQEAAIGAQEAEEQAGGGSQQKPSSTKRLHFQPQISQLLNEWFVRGVAGACAASADKGRGIVVVDAAYETELVSRLAHHLAMWRLPTMRVVGVALNGEKNDSMLSDYRVSKLDVNHSHFILCARPENLRNMATDMSMCRSSPAVDAAEVISESFKSTKTALLQVRSAVRARLNHKRHQKHEQIQKQQLLGADSTAKAGDSPLGFVFGKSKPKIKPVFAAGGAVPGSTYDGSIPSPSTRQVSKVPGTLLRILPLTLFALMPTILLSHYPTKPNK
jgi:hypothetical protein